jgi:ABC-2 type transport system ATP-binding protein
VARIRIEPELGAAVDFDWAGVRLPQRTRRGGGKRKHQMRRFAGEVSRDEVWMLRDASFTVAPGEALAVVGHRGSGREEVLRLAAGTLMPDQGSVQRSISFVPIIGLGGALERKYTVRQNIYLIGGLIGMLPEQVTARLPWIVETAGVAKILDKYLADATRAIRAKLLWSIAMSAEASGYAISQAVVVGQPEFRRTGWEVIEGLKAQGATFLVTSDKPSHLLRFCDRAILLDAGTVVADTSVQEALDLFAEIPPPKDQVHFVIDDDDDDDDDEDLV